MKKEVFLKELPLEVKELRVVVNKIWTDILDSESKKKKLKNKYFRQGHRNQFNNIIPAAPCDGLTGLNLMKGRRRQ